MQTFFLGGLVRSLTEVIYEEIEKHDTIIYQFSGGKDSQIAMEIVSELAKYAGKKEVACFVDTGAEMDSVKEHVVYTTDRLSIPLVILKGPDAVEYFRKMGAFPHPVFKDCIHRLINTPINNYAKTQPKPLIITGHRPSQANGKSTMRLTNRVANGKLETLNPLFAIGNDEFDRACSRTILWEGYAKGYRRTACWCCPFQEEAHWDTMRQDRPDLWLKMKDLMNELPVFSMDDRPSRGVVVRAVKPYWGDKHGCRIRYKHHDKSINENP